MGAGDFAAGLATKDPASVDEDMSVVEVVGTAEGSSWRVVTASSSIGGTSLAVCEGTGAAAIVVSAFAARSTGAGVSAIRVASAGSNTSFEFDISGTSEASFNIGVLTVRVGIEDTDASPAAAASATGGTEGARTEVDRDREGSRPGEGFAEPLVAACLAALRRLNLPPFDAEVDELEGAELSGRARCTGRVPAFLTGKAALLGVDGAGAAFGNDADVAGSGWAGDRTEPGFDGPGDGMGCCEFTGDDGTCVDNGCVDALGFGTANSSPLRPDSAPLAS